MWACAYINMHLCVVCMYMCKIPRKSDNNILWIARILWQLSQIVVLIQRKEVEECILLSDLLYMFCLTHMLSNFWCSFPISTCTNTYMNSQRILKERRSTGLRAMWRHLMEGTHGSRGCVARLYIYRYLELSFLLL